MDWEYSVVEEEAWMELEARQANLAQAADAGWELLNAVYNPARASMMYFFRRSAGLRPGSPGDD